MRNPSWPGLLLLALALAVGSARAQEEPPWVMYAQTPEGHVSFNLTNNIFIGTNGVVVSNRNVVLTTDCAEGNNDTGEVEARGHVSIQGKGHQWEGTNAVYNFRTGEMRAGEFRTMQRPFYVEGHALGGNEETNIFFANDAIITTDNYSEPSYWIRAARITIVPGEYVEAQNATLVFGGVPVMYLPYYHKHLGRHPNNITIDPGYRSLYGPYFLSAYNWYYSEELSGSVHADWRERRGFGGGPDLNWNYGEAAQGGLKLYYANDQNPNIDNIGKPVAGDRYRIAFTNQSLLTTNLSANVVAHYQSDPLVIRDFFEREYQQDIQPGTYFELNQRWSNYTLDLLAQPRVNDFFETVERLPDVRLMAAPQQLWATPVYYDGESSFAYLDRQFSSLGPGTNYSAARLDSYHQLTMPQTAFGWLQVTPRVGGRVTWYGAGDGINTATNQQTRAVLNTGAEVSWKASRVWRNVDSDFWDAHELRHIIEPSFNYVFVPAPNVRPAQLPQFDYQVQSTELPPLNYPEYNAIDAIDSQNVVRLSLGNRLQTKRAGNVENLLRWDLFTDWRLDPGTNQTRFSDVYSRLELKPRRWLTFDSSIRMDVAAGHLRETYHGILIQPNSTWSASLTHHYLINNDSEFATAPGVFPPGNNTFIGSIYYRLNENWAAHAAEIFEARDGTWQQQSYSIYRDLRSWTMALTVRMIQNVAGHPSDFSIGLMFSLKAFPRYGLGTDADQAMFLPGG